MRNVWLHEAANPDFQAEPLVSNWEPRNRREDI